MPSKEKTIGFLKIILVILLFVLAIFLTQIYSTQIGSYLDFGYIGMGLYVLLGISATVVAPVSTIPLIPVATALWGGLITALLNIIAWTIGAIIAFVISRRFGKPLIKKYVNLEKVSCYENLLGEKYIFWNIVVLRIIIPVDILSYAIGLFTSVKLSTYAIASFLGIIPFAFVLSYLPTMSLVYQISLGIIIAVVAYLGYRRINKI